MVESKEEHLCLVVPEEMKLVKEDQKMLHKKKCELAP
jgi:hypothetical protein